MPLSDLGSLPPAIAAPLKTYNSLEERHAAAQRSFPTIGSLSLILAAAAGLDALTPLGHTSRIFLSVAVWSLLSLSLFWSLHPLFRRRKALAAARALEAHIGSLHEALISAVQFAQDSTHSGWMVRRTIAIAAHHLQDLDLAKLFAGRRSYRFIAAALLVLAGFLSVMWASTSARQHVLRVLFPSEALLRPSVIELRITPDHDISIIRGQALAIAIQANPDPGEVSCEIADGLGTRNLSLDRIGPGLYRAGWNAVQSSFRFRANAGDARSAWYRVDVEAPPSLEAISLKVSPPVGSRRAPWTIPAADANIPKGSTISFLAHFAGTLATQVLLQGEDGSSIPLQIKGKEVSGEFSPQATGLWSLHMTDAKGLVHDEATQWRLTLVGDAPPTVTMTGPGLREAVFGAEEILPLTISAQDDNALDWVRLDLGLPDGRIERTALPAKGVKAEGVSLLDLGRWKLLPGETITLEAIAKDSAGQEGRSARTRILIGPETPSIPAKLLESLQLLREKTRFIASHLQASQTAWNDIRHRRRSGLDSTLEDEARRERQRLIRIFVALNQAQEQTRTLLFTANSPALASLRPLFQRLELDLTLAEVAAKAGVTQESTITEVQQALEAANVVQKDLSRQVGLLTLWADLGLWKARAESIHQRRSRIIPLYRAALHFDPGLLATSKYSHEELVRILSHTAGGDTKSLEGKLVSLYSFLSDFTGSMKQRLVTMHDDELALVRRDIANTLQRTNDSEALLRKKLPLIHKELQALDGCECAAQAIGAGINAAYQQVEQALASLALPGDKDNLIPTLRTEAQAQVQDLLRRDPLRDPSWNSTRMALEHTLSRLSTELQRQESEVKNQEQAPNSGALERVLASEARASLRAFREKIDAERTRLDPLEAPSFQSALKSLEPKLHQLEQLAKLDEELHRAQAGALARKAQGLIAELGSDSDPTRREKAAKELIPLLYQASEAAANAHLMQEAKTLAEARLSAAAPENLKPRDLAKSLESLTAMERRQLEHSMSIARDLEARQRNLGSEPLLAKAILESLPQRMQLRAENLEQQGKSEQAQAERALAQKTARLSSENPVADLASIQREQAALERMPEKTASPGQDQTLAKIAAASLTGDRKAQEALSGQLRSQTASQAALAPSQVQIKVQTQAQAQETLGLLAALDAKRKQSQDLAAQLGTQMERVPVSSASQAALQQLLAQAIPTKSSEDNPPIPVFPADFSTSASQGQISARNPAAAILASMAAEGARSASQAGVRPQAQSLSSLAQRLAAQAANPQQTPAPPVPSSGATLAQLSRKAEQLAQELRRDLLAPALAAALERGTEQEMKQELKQASELAANIAALEQAAEAVQNSQEEERRLARRLADMGPTKGGTPSPSATAAALEKLARQQDNAEKALAQASQQSEEAAKAEAQAAQDEAKLEQATKDAQKEAEEAVAAAERAQADSSPTYQQAQAAAQKRAAEAAKRVEQAQTQAQQSRARASQRETNAQKARDAALLAQNAVLEPMAALAEQVEQGSSVRDQQRLAALAKRAAQTAETLADIVPAPTTATQAVTMAQAGETLAQANAVEDGLLAPLLAATAQALESAVTAPQDTIPQATSSPQNTDLPAYAMAAAQAAMAQQQTNQAAQLISMASLDQAMMPANATPAASAQTESSQASAQGAPSSATSAQTSSSGSAQASALGNGPGSTGNGGSTGKHQDGAIDTSPTAKGSEQSDWSRLKASMENAVRQSSEERFGEEDQAAIRAYFTRLSQEGQ